MTYTRVAQRTGSGCCGTCTQNRKDDTVWITNPDYFYAFKGVVQIVFDALRDGPPGSPPLPELKWKITSYESNCGNVNVSGPVSWTGEIWGPIILDDDIGNGMSRYLWPVTIGTPGLEDIRKILTLRVWTANGQDAVASAVPNIIREAQTKFITRKMCRSEANPFSDGCRYYCNEAYPGSDCMWGESSNPDLCGIGTGSCKPKKCTGVSCANVAITGAAQADQCESLDDCYSCPRWECQYVGGTVGSAYQCRQVMYPCPAPPDTCRPGEFGYCGGYQCQGVGGCDIVNNESGCLNPENGPCMLECDPANDGEGTCWHYGCSGGECARILGAGQSYCTPGSTSCKKKICNPNYPYDCVTVNVNTQNPADDKRPTCSCEPGTDCASCFYLACHLDAFGQVLCLKKPKITGYEVNQCSAECKTGPCNLDILKPACIHDECREANGCVDVWDPVPGGTCDPSRGSSQCPPPSVCVNGKCGLPDLCEHNIECIGGDTTVPVYVGSTDNFYLTKSRGQQLLRPIITNHTPRGGKLCFLWDGTDAGASRPFYGMKADGLYLHTGEAVANNSRWWIEIATGLGNQRIRPIELSGLTVGNRIPQTAEFDWSDWLRPVNGRPVTIFLIVHDSRNPGHTMIRNGFMYPITKNPLLYDARLPDGSHVDCADLLAPFDVDALQNACAESIEEPDCLGKALYNLANGIETIVNDSIFAAIYGPGGITGIADFGNANLGNIAGGPTEYPTDVVYETGRDVTGMDPGDPTTPVIDPCRGSCKWPNACHYSGPGQAARCEQTDDNGLPPCFAIGKSVNGIAFNVNYHNGLLVDLGLLGPEGTSFYDNYYNVVSPGMPPLDLVDCAGDVCMRFDTCRKCVDYFNAIESGRGFRECACTFHYTALSSGACDGDPMDPSFGGPWHTYHDLPLVNLSRCFGRNDPAFACPNKGTADPAVSVVGGVDNALLNNTFLRQSAGAVRNSGWY